MPVDSPKCKEAEEKLPSDLIPIYHKMVEEYEYITHLKYGRGYVAYEVLADMVLAGWRPSGEPHESSKI